MKGDPLITVCSACLMASCWNGLFMCDASHGAGTVQRRKSYLRELGREHPDYWRPATYENLR